MTTTLLGGRIANGLVNGVLSWNEARKGQEVMIHLTSGVKSAQTHKFLKRRGFEAIGGVMLMLTRLLVVQFVFSIPVMADSVNENNVGTTQGFAGWSSVLRADKMQEICLRSKLLCTHQTEVFDLFNAGSFFAFVTQSNQNGYRLAFVDITGFQYGDSLECASGLNVLVNKPKIEHILHDITTISNEVLVGCGGYKILIRSTDQYSRGLDVGHVTLGYGLNGETGTRYTVANKQIEIEF